MAGTITYTLTEQDVVTTRRVQYREGATSPRPLGKNALVLTLLWLIGFGTNLIEGSTWGEAARDSGIFIVAIVVPLSLLVGLGYGLSAHRARRLFRQQKTLHQEYRASWSDDALELQSVTTTARIVWSDFDSWRQGAAGYLLYLSDVNCHYMPRRCFTDEQWADMEDTLVRSGLRRRSGRIDREPEDPRVAAPETGRSRWWGIAAWSNPGRVALLWVILAILAIADSILFADAGGMVSRALFLSGTPVLAGLLAGRALRLRSATLGLVSIFLALAIGFQVEWLLAEAIVPEEQGALFFSILAAGMILVAFMVMRLRFSHRGGKRNWAAMGLFIATLGGAAWFAQANPIFYRASATAREALGIGSSEEKSEAEKAYDAISDIPVDRLWGAQPRLVAKAVDGLAPRVAGRPDVYALTVAAGGSQQLFAREARLARDVAAARFGADYRGGVLLSNGVADILKTPLATQDNMAAAADGLAHRMDPAQDLAFIYLVSHGSRDAELQTDLPTYDDLSPISAASVADALAHSGIKRRVVVVSACFSGSWIPALANDDTIIITAARKDRTSFGCDDSLALTYFGEAFLHGPLAKGASLHDAFDAARRAIAAREGQDRLTPSEPQVFVGRNMQALWTQSR